MKVLDRDILRLAVPALGALVAEPLFLLTDSALVGHLGEAPLAGLGIASALLQSAIGVLIFLAYATTPAVARLLGSGNTGGAIRAGIDGLWLALGIGVALSLAGLATGPALVGLFGARADVAAQAETYLLVSLAGIPAMLLVIAATGLFRGLQDTRTPLVVAVAGFGANIALNVVFIYGFGWGIAGSAGGTVVAQWAMAVVLLTIAGRKARANGVSLAPGLAGVRGAAKSGGWLLVRTASLRVAILGSVAVASGLGVTQLAAFQVAITVFFTIAFILDALAIAGQALIGHGLGAADVDRVRSITRRLIGWAIGSGVVLGLLLAAASPFLGGIFSSDADVQRAISVTTLVMAAGVPLAGFVFVLDGVLIGAGDARYLALTGIVNLAVYAPMLIAVAVLHPAGDAGLIWLWVALGYGYVAARAVTLGLRARTSAWLVTGVRA